MAKAVKKKSAKEASNVFHNIMQASVKGNPKPTPELKKIRDQYFETVKDKPISKDLPNYLIVDIQLHNGIPHVIAMDTRDGALIKTQLSSWLSDNGY